MSRKQAVILIVAFVLALVIGLVTRFPATSALKLLSLPPQIQLQGVDGSIFRGRIGQLKASGIVLRQVDYRVQALCVLGLKLCANLHSEQEEIDLNVERSLLSSAISVVSSQVKLGNSLVDRMPGLLVKPQGDISLRIDSVELSEDMKLLSAAAVADWRNASIEGEEQILGDYRMDLSSSDDGIGIQLSANPDNPLAAEGEISIAWTGAYDADITLRAGTGLNSALRGILSSFAKKTGLDLYRLRKSGRLPRQAANQISSLKPE